MSDAWGSQDTCGVKLGPFEQLTRRMNAAAPSLENLSRELWNALNRAGVTTEPAVEILQISRWAAQTASDLTRRDRLVHELDRQDLVMKVCTPNGTYLRLPDSYADQLADGHARLAALAIRRAASGDLAALRRLRELGRETTEPLFARTLMESLGPDAAVRTPIDLTLRLRIAINNADDKGSSAASSVRLAFSLLSRSLAAVTDPDSAAYLGDVFLHRLVALGNDRYPHNFRFPGGIAGYQGLATLLAAPNPIPYSVRFMEVVGRDMIAFDRSMAPHLPGTALPTLVTVHDLGNALDGPTHCISPGPRTTDLLIPLLTLASAGPATAQALLNHTPTGSRISNLDYLLHERRAVWSTTDHGAALGAVLQAAASGQDPVSTSLFDQAVHLLAHDTLRHVSYAPGGHLSISDQDTLDQLHALRPHLATLLIAHLGPVAERLRSSDRRGHLKDDLTFERDIQGVIADVSMNDKAFNRLLLAQIAHTKALFDQQYAQPGVRGQDAFDNLLHQEAGMLGRLLAIHREVLSTRESREAAENAEIKDWIGKGVGLIPIPYAEKFGGVTKEVYEQVTKSGYAKAGEWLGQRLAEQPSPANSDATRTTDEDAVIDLTKQMLISAATHAPFSPTDLRGRSFAPSGKILPPNTWTNAQTDAFLEMCDSRGMHVSSTGDNLESYTRESRYRAINSFARSR
jgi:hypothetical protein